MIPKFNPGFQSDREAIDHFVVRRSQLELIVSALLAARASVPAPRILVSAPRGAGKTTLCRRVVAELRTNDELSAYWQPIFLGEESYSVTTPGEFLLEVLLQLTDQLPEAALEAKLEYARGAVSESDLISRCLTVLRNCANTIGKRFLIVVENFHMILADQLQGNESSKGLLELLDDDDLFAVLATSVTKAVDGAESLLPTNYTPVELKALNLGECKDLWRFLTGGEVPAEKIRPIQILTGGSPRLLHILADFMKTRSLRDLMENLNLLIDQNTEYFKSQLDALPTIERKVFAALLEIWDPSTAKQVAEAARVTTNIASAMLARLTDRGAVIKEPGQGRTSRYFAAERLFNIYYLMRRRTHPSSRVKALVAFMVDFYSEEELVDTTALLAREACNVEPSGRGDYHSTFDAILARSSDSVREEILRSAPTEFIRSFRQEQRESRSALDPVETAKAGGETNKLNELIQQIETAADQGELETARELILEALELEPAMTELWVRRAFVENELGRTTDAVASARRATQLDPSDPWTFTVLALALSQADQWDAAETSYRAALELDPGHEPALTTLASRLERHGDVGGAILLYEKAHSADELTDITRATFAQLLSRHQKSDRAEELLREVVDDPNNWFCRRTLIGLLQREGRSEEAQRLLENFAEREGRWQAFADLGRYLLLMTNNGPAARDALKMAISMGADDPIIYWRLARAMILAPHTPDEVSAVAVEMISRFSDDAKAWIYSGLIHRTLENATEAEVAFRSALERENGEDALLCLADLLEDDPNRHAEVEALLRQAVEAETGRRKCVPMRHLAEFLIHRGEDRRAREVLEEAMAANDRCGCCMVLHGDVCRRSGEIQTAEDGYRRALRLVGQDVGALTGLAQLVMKKEATELVAQALTADPNDPRALLAKIQLVSADKREQRAAAKQLVAQSPQFIEGRLFMSTLEAEEGNLPGAVEQLSAALDNLPKQRELIPLFVRTAMLIAAADSSQVSALLEAHGNRDVIEPLTVAVQLSRGEKPVVAQEVLEVAKDIVLRSRPKGSVLDEQY